MAVVVFIQALLESSSENDSGKVSTERGSFLENRLTDYTRCLQKYFITSS